MKFQSYGFLDSLRLRGWPSWPSGWLSENQWPFSMMSQPMRKPGMPQGLERPDRTMELRRPALLGGAAPSPRMAVYILGVLYPRPGEAPGEAPTWGDMGEIAITIWL